MTSTWDCPSCTLENEPTDNTCTVCNTPRPKIARSPSPPSPQTTTKILRVWEWFGGGRWQEYPVAVSELINKSYAEGQVQTNISLEFENGNSFDYVIDLHQLCQINPVTNRKRKLRRVRYEEEIVEDEDAKADEAEDIVMTQRSPSPEPVRKRKSPPKKRSRLPTRPSSVPEKKKNPPKNDDEPEGVVPSLPDSATFTMADLSSGDELEIISSPKKKKKKKDVVQGDIREMFGGKKRKKQDDDGDVEMSLPKAPKRKKKRPLSDDDGDKELGEPPKKKRKVQSPSSPIPKRKRGEAKDSPNKVKIAGKYGLAAQKPVKGNVGADLNKELIEILWEMSMIERNAGNRHKANAYSKACKSLRETNKKITSGKEASDLNGIGKKIALKIDEILSTGRLDKLETLRADEKVQAINELCQVHGIGPKKANELVNTHNITTIKELKKHLNLLNHQQIIGLKYFDDIQERIPRAEVTKIGEIVELEMKKLDPKLIMDICGSYRREKETCGDVDILLTHPKLKSSSECSKMFSKIVSSLKKCNLLRDDLAQGPSKYMGICRLDNEIEGHTSVSPSLPKMKKKASFHFDLSTLDAAIGYDDTDVDPLVEIQADENGDVTLDPPQKMDVDDDGKEKDDGGKRPLFRRIDLKYIPFSSYYCALLYFTGSDNFNREMRLKANEKRMILNENGIFEMLDEDDHSLKGKRVAVAKSEQDLFDLIGMDYVEPVQRSW